MNYMTNRTSERLYSAAEIAAIVLVEPRTIHNWARNGLIPVALRIGKTVRFDLDEVSQTLEEETRRAQLNKLDRIGSTKPEIMEKSVGDPGPVSEAASPWN